MTLVVSGVQVAYRELGTGDPVVLLHGSAPGASADETWARTIPAVAAMGYRAIAPDVIGFGDSGRPAAFPYHAVGWADSIADFLAVIGVGSAHVVGNSMGGRIALTLAARRQDLVRSLTLVSVRAPGTEMPAGLAELRSYTPSAANMRHVLRDLLVVDPELISEDLISRRHAASAAPGEHDHYQRMFSTAGSSDTGVTEAEIRGIRQPTLIVHGLQDKVIPVEHALRLAAMIPDVTAVTISRCGHWPQIERPDIFDRQLAAFLASCP